MKEPEPGESTRHEDARTAPHAARQDPGSGPGRLGSDEEPGWLDEDAPPDPDGDDRVWPEPFGQLAAQAEADGAEETAARERLLAAGTEIGSAHWPGGPAIPGVKSGPAGGFGQGQPLDNAAPDWQLAERADYASGTQRLFAHVDDDELFGILGARRKLEARQAWERLMSIAEVIRRRPAPGCKLRGPAMMPAVWAEGTAGELGNALGITRRDADGLLSLAWDLVVKLPLTSGNLRDGVIDAEKARISAGQTRNLTAEEAGEAEKILFGTPGIETMTKTMIRDRIKAAAITVNPDAAVKYREQKAKERRIITGPEESGNAMITARELPPPAVLAIDRTLTARARQLRKLGIAADLDELRVLAFLERWGEADPAGDHARAMQAQRRSSGDDTDGDGRNSNDGGNGGDGDGGNGPRPGGTNGGGGCTCGQARPEPGLRGSLHLTGPAATLTGDAERPAIMPGIGPIDPALFRDLAARLTASPATTFCYTATGKDGRPVAHACGKPGPGDRNKPRKPGEPGTPGTGEPDPPAAMTRIGRGPPGSLGTWQFTTGSKVIIFEFENLEGECDHKHQASGHDPGRRLRHLIGVLNQTCTHPTCRRPEKQCDTEHSRPYDQGGITCLCETGPVCRRNHRDKQQPGWKLRQAGARGWFTWTMPSGRTYTTGPTIYPI
jgi:hypothetical protein